MHDYADFDKWVEQHEDYKTWKDEQNFGSDTSTSAYLDTLSEEETEELREEYDKYCEEMKKDSTVTSKKRGKKEKEEEKEEDGDEEE